MVCYPLNALMRKFIAICIAAMMAITVQAQFVNFPRFGRSLKMSNDPVLGLRGLHVGDEGYVTFNVTNQGDSVYTGPIYLRIIEREQHTPLPRYSPRTVSTPMPSTM